MKAVFKIVVVSFACLPLLIVPVTVDLHYLGDKPSWSLFGRMRVKLYLEAAAFVGFLVPPVGPLAIVHYGAVLVDAYIDKDLPPIRSMGFIRKLVLSSPGSTRTEDGFFSRLHEREGRRASCADRRSQC